MKLFEVIELETEVRSLDEAFDLDFVQLYKTYGSWWHPNEPEPIIVPSQTGGHEAAAQQIVGTDPSVPIRRSRDVALSKMYQQGWVRAVHGGMQNFFLSGTKAGLQGILPKLRGLRSALEGNKIIITKVNCDEQSCEEDKNNIKGFLMPAKWNELLQAVQ